VVMEETEVAEEAMETEMAVGIVEVVCGFKG
jgi:hypothetical protein